MWTVRRHSFYFQQDVKAVITRPTADSAVFSRRCFYKANADITDVDNFDCIYELPDCFRISYAQRLSTSFPLIFFISSGSVTQLPIHQPSNAVYVTHSLFFKRYCHIMRLSALAVSALRCRRIRIHCLQWRLQVHYTLAVFSSAATKLL